MTLGASALGQLELGGASAAAATYVDVAAGISITSAVACNLSIAGQVHIAADIAITSAVQCSLTINEPVYGDVHISAAITMISELAASLTALQPMPNAGVSFSMSDKAGGV